MQMDHVEQQRYTSHRMTSNDWIACQARSEGAASPQAPLMVADVFCGTIKATACTIGTSCRLFSRRKIALHPEKTCYLIERVCVAQLPDLSSISLISVGAALAGVAYTAIAFGGSIAEGLQSESQNGHHHPSYNLNGKSTVAACSMPGQPWVPLYTPLVLMS